MLDIINQLLMTILSFVPRMVIVRSTHAGIKFRRGKIPKPMHPGLHWYWPLVSEVDIRVTARQTNTLPPQVLETKDGVGVVVGGYVVFYISDILAACATNWDVDNTVDDIARSAMVEVVTSHTYEELRRGMTLELTKKCRSKLKQFGVGIKRAGVTDLSRCKTYRVVGGMPSGQQQ